MARKRFSPGRIVAKLREAQRLQGQGTTVAQVCRRIGVCDQSFFRWRVRYGALKDDEAPAVAAVGVGEFAIEADRGGGGA